MLKCKELTELVTDYLEARLPFSQRASFYLHLSMCRNCRAYLRQMKMTVRTLGKLHFPNELIAPSVRDELLVQLQRVRRKFQAVTSRHPTAVAHLESWLGRARGWVLVGLVLFASALWGVLRAGQKGAPFAMWSQCLLMELGSAALPVIVVGAVAVRARERISTGSLAALGASGALMGYLILWLVCPSTYVTEHVLMVHVSGILLGALLGAAASSLVAFR